MNHNNTRDASSMIILETVANQSPMLAKESPTNKFLDNTQNKEHEASLRKLQKRKKYQKSMIAPKPEMINQAGKRFKKPTAVTIKSKKRQSESGK